MDISFINNDKLSDKEKKVKLQQIKYNLQRNLNILEKELDKDGKLVSIVIIL